MLAKIKSLEKILSEFKYLIGNKGDNRVICREEDVCYFIKLNTGKEFVFDKYYIDTFLGKERKINKNYTNKYGFSCFFDSTTGYIIPNNFIEYSRLENIFNDMLEEIC